MLLNLETNNSLLYQQLFSVISVPSYEDDAIGTQSGLLIRLSSIVMISPWVYAPRQSKYPPCNIGKTTTDNNHIISAKVKKEVSVSLSFTYQIHPLFKITPFSICSVLSINKTALTCDKIFKMLEIMITNKLIKLMTDIHLKKSVSIQATL